MDNISTHNDNNLMKERTQQSKQSRVISTRNVVPYNRPVTKNDVNTFVEKRNAILAKNTDEEIKSAVAKLDNERRVTEERPIMTRPGINFTDEQKETVKNLYNSGDICGAQKIILDNISDAEQHIIDYAAERAKTETIEDSDAENIEDVQEADKPKRGRKQKEK